MLVCTVHKDFLILSTVEWEPGRFSVPPMIFGLKDAAVQVTATGTSLEWIRINIVGIRMPRDRQEQVIWVGEDAVFIMNNLPRPIRPPDMTPFDVD